MFGNDDMRLMHVSLHHGHVECLCIICHLPFNRLDELSGHRRHKHGETNTFFEFRCKSCPLTTKNENHLYEHVLSRTCRVDTVTFTHHVMVTVRSRVYDKGVSPTPPPVQMAPDTTCPEDKPSPKVSTPVTTMASSSAGSPDRPSWLNLIHKRVEHEVQAGRHSDAPSAKARPVTHVTPSYRPSTTHEFERAQSSFKRPFPGSENEDSQPEVKKLVRVNDLISNTIMRMSEKESYSDNHTSRGFRELNSSNVSINNHVLLYHYSVQRISSSQAKRKQIKRIFYDSPFLLLKFV